MISAGKALAPRGGYFDLLEKGISIEVLNPLLPLGPIVSDNSLAPPFEGCCLEAIYRPCPVLSESTPSGSVGRTNSGGCTPREWVCVCAYFFVCLSLSLSHPLCVFLCLCLSRGCVCVCLFSVCLCAMLQEMHHILLLIFGR